jgi:hypothetical protein
VPEADALMVIPFDTIAEFFTKNLEVKPLTQTRR